MSCFRSTFSHLYGTNPGDVDQPGAVFQQSLLLVQLYWHRETSVIKCVQNILFDCAQINKENYLHKNIQQNLHANANERLCSWSNFIGAVRLPVINQVQNILFVRTQINKANCLHQNIQQNLHANANELLCSWSNFIGAMQLPVIKCVQNILFDCTHKQ